MVFSGGWRVLVGALVLAAGVVAPVSAVADPVVCDRWTETELPVPDGAAQTGIGGAAGNFAVGNGSFRWADGSTVLVWKGGQLADQLFFNRATVHAMDVNSSGVVILSGRTYSSASRWEAGVFTTLRGWQGEYRVEAIDVNERGDVLGESDGKPVVWPAGSSDAQLVPGTDASWSAIGIADDGTVLAASNTGTYWLTASGPVRLAGDESVEVTAVRGSYAVGRSGSKIVRWDLQGQSSGGFAEAVDALDVNAHGHLLGTWDNHTTTGATGVWSDADRFAPVNSGARFGFLTDGGDLYGTYVSDPWNTIPVVLRCDGSR